MKAWNLALGCGAVGLLAGVLACSKLPGEPTAYNGDSLPPGGDLPSGQGVGADCSTQDCRPGLACVQEVCQPGHSLAAGARCLIGPECQEGLACIAGSCAPAGDGALGESCTPGPTSDAECGPNLRCNFIGLQAVCAASGVGDLGAICATQSSCYQGLYCADGKCSPPELPLGVPLWKGVECSKPNDDKVSALFSVPGAAATPEDADFFQLPFPNDIRLGSNGRVDLDGFPTPGPELLGVDMVKRYVDALEKQAHGWSTAPSIIFRFSGAVDFESLKVLPNPVVLVDADDEAPGHNPLGLGWRAGGGATKYVCDNWLAVGQGSTLVPRHTYLAWVTTAARTSKDKPVARSPQFTAMLAAAAPSDPALSQAYDKYEPLRSYLASHSIDPDTILVATVFTTDDPIEPMRALAEQVVSPSEPVPTASGWVLCADGVESPCPQAEGSRACGKATADYEEYQALVSLPIYQDGEAPYADEGGYILSSRQRTEDVCMSLTVPQGTAPAAGWPLVIYGHGTGGSMRSHVNDKVAGRLARATPSFAVLGIDQVEHGPRRGDSQEDPQNLFFNFLNPDAARGNPMQGAADQLSLYRFAQTLSVSAAATGGRAFAIDASRIVYYGHSQGSTHGSLALPLSDFPGAVLSGNGGALRLALLHKTKPVNIAQAVPFALQDVDGSGKLAMEELNPALGLLQHYMDAADPMTFAPLVALRPEEGRDPKHVFEPFGLGDSYAPPQTMASYIHAASLMQLAPAPSGVDPSGDNDLGLTVQAAPVTANVAGTYTVVTRQYKPPSGKDGHYVSTDVPACVDDITAFLEQVAQGNAPTVPAP